MSWWGRRWLRSHSLNLITHTHTQVGPMLLMVVVTVGSFAVTLVLASTGFFESQRSAAPGGKGKGERGKGEGAPFGKRTR